MSEECAIEYIAVKHGLKVPEEDIERIIPEEKLTPMLTFLNQEAFSDAVFA